MRKPTTNAAANGQPVREPYKTLLFISINQCSSQSLSEKPLLANTKEGINSRKKH